MFVNQNIHPSIQLPIRRSPLRFAVMRKNGLCSNAWGVYVDNNGEVYISCRDGARELKVSLHKSGQQHIAFTRESGILTMEGDRFWNQWTEPHHSNSSPLIPSFKLVFPSWALGLTYDDRRSNPKIWSKNQIIIESSEVPLVTQVSFLKTDDDFTMSHSDFTLNHGEFTVSNSDSSSYPLGVIPAAAGKNLWVIAHHGPEGNLRDLIVGAISQMNSTMDKSIFREHAGSVLSACFSGFHHDGWAYLLTTPIKVHCQST